MLSFIYRNTLLTLGVDIHSISEDNHFPGYNLRLMNGEKISLKSCDIQQSITVDDITYCEGDVIQSYHRGSDFGELKIIGYLLPPDGIGDWEVITQDNTYQLSDITCCKGYNMNWSKKDIKIIGNRYQK